MRHHNCAIYQTVHISFNVRSNHTTFKLQRTRIPYTQFAVYISDTPVTFKQSQGHQTYNDNVNPKQGYNHAKFERTCSRSVKEKGNVKGFSNKEICPFSPLTMCKNQKQWHIYDLLDVINNCTKFQLHRRRTV